MKLNIDAFSNRFNIFFALLVYSLKCKHAWSSYGAKVAETTNEVAKKLPMYGLADIQALFWGIFGPSF